MVRSRALTQQNDPLDLSIDGRPAANDEPAMPLRLDIPFPTLPETVRMAPCPANDDWIEVDLPTSINVLAEEILMLDQFLRAQILALFD